MNKQNASNIYLIGFRCTGKTCVGRILSTLSGLVFVDTDQVIQEKMDQSISDMVEQYGWDYFRGIEKQVFQEISVGSGQVVSTGGGIVLDKDNRGLLKKTGTTIWLTANQAVLLERIQSDPSTDTTRPFLTQKDLKAEICEIMEARRPLYSRSSEFSLDTSNDSPAQIAQMILRRLYHDRI